MELSSSLSEVKGVGAATGKLLTKLGLETVEDLLFYYPRRYDDYSEVLPIAKIKPGPVTIKAVIKQVRGRYARRGMHVTEAAASDDSSSVRIIWFNQPYRAASLKPDEEYFISGEFVFRNQRLSIINPSAELVSSFPINTARIIPIYSETKGLTSTTLRKMIKQVRPVYQSLPESLPKWLIEEEALMPRAAAIEQLHFPKSPEALTEAKQRLGFEEVFELTLAALLNKYALATEHAVGIAFNEKLAKQFVGALPFKLTDDQRKVVWQVYQDMQRDQPMNRLVEGDVGSGKTVVAAMAALMALAQDFQVALMAPTELLARQHAETIFHLLQPLGLHDQVTLLVGGMKPAQKTAAHKAIQEGKARFIIGTHALIQDKVITSKLGLVIIDEQHRFGVEQRKTLQKKAGHAVHVLSLTATPIPRSLALTLYGEMDISVLAEKPKNRLPIETQLVPQSSREKLYEKVKAAVAAGRQVYWVCPRIIDDEASTLPKLTSAEALHKQLSTRQFKKLRVGLLHGNMKAPDKDMEMQQFANGDIDILVATTVIEVGVDVPNATLMVIENPERFGLAQLHQLRGRVGRGEHQSYCFLQLSDANAPSRRLRAIAGSTDGFKLAELDLELRGPGAVYGTMQHGALDLRMAKLTDTKLIAAARARAQEFIDRGEKLVHYKQLRNRVDTARAITNLN